MLVRPAFLREIAHNTRAILQAIAKPGHLLQAASNKLPSNNALAIIYALFQTSLSVRIQTPHVGQAEPDMAKADALW